MSCARPDTPRSDAKSVAELGEPLRSRVHTAILDAPTNGLVLVSGYRDPGRQWDLRRERCRGRECDRSCKGVPTTGLPAVFDGTNWVGGSKHQHRAAADMGGRELDWLIANRFQYGLGLTVKSESWHFEAAGTDTRTGSSIAAPTHRIIPFGDTAEPAPPPRPKILKRNSTGDFVIWYQTLLGIAADRNPNIPHPGKADGSFGKDTERSVRGFEAEWNKFLAEFTPSAKRLQVDGVLTEPSMNALEWTVRNGG